MQHTKRTIKKIPPTTIIHSTTSWPFHCHASWLTLYMPQVKVIDPCWAFCCCIESPVIGIVFHCKHNFYTFIYSKPESNIKNIKIKISSTRHKACLNPILVTNWPQTHNLRVPHESSPRQRFHMKSRVQFKFPTHWKTLINKFPPPLDGKGVKCPGFAQGGGGGC